MLVSDDGCGFDTEAEREGFGLDGMRERVELVGGELQIESKPGSGTRMMATIPFAGGTAGSGLDESPGERALD